jgi:hypothetical protein
MQWRDTMLAQVFLNKQIVSRLRCSDGSDFPFSMTVTAYQLLIALVLCGFLPKGSLPSRCDGLRRIAARSGFASPQTAGLAGWKCRFCGSSCR